MRNLNRVIPSIGPERYKTYQLLAPVATHRRPATCEEVSCDASAHGWLTLVDEATDLGQRQAAYIRRDSRRAFRESRTPEGLTRFEFSAGQRCFAQHSVPIERDPLFIVKDGDFRGNPRGTRPRQHVRAADWVEDFAEHQDKIVREIEKG